MLQRRPCFLLALSNLQCVRKVLFSHFRQGSLRRQECESGDVQMWGTLGYRDVEVLDKSLEVIHYSELGCTLYADVVSKQLKPELKHTSQDLH